MAQVSAIASQTEIEIVGGCLTVLRSHGVLAWRQNNAPIPVGARRVPGGGISIRGWRSVAIKGIADIGAVTPGGRALQIEVKRPGEKPRVEQAAWLNSVYRLGGIAMAATSVADVMQLCVDARRLGWERVESPWRDGGGVPASRPRWPKG